MATARITKFIGGHEGKVNSWYLDPTGTATIGYGATMLSRVAREWFQKNFGRKMKRGDTLTDGQCLELLSLMIDDEYAPPVEKKFSGRKVNIKEAGTSFVLNAGAGALNWQWANFIAQGKIREGCERWRVTATTSKGKRLPGLVRRRGEEADIAEFNRWPDWMGVIIEGQAVDITPPESHVIADDIKQAQLWLEELGYSPGPADGIPGNRTTLAVKRFQKDHGTLKDDGIIGPATLSALQRTIDLKKKGAIVAGGGTVVAGGGVAENTTGAADAVPVEGLGIIGDVLLWGGIAFAVIGLVYLAWRYRDEINALIRKL